MPSVPTYDNFQAQQSAQPMAAFDAPALPDVAGRQMQEMGKAQLHAGAVLQKIQDNCDDAAAKEADNALADRLRVSLYDKDNGYLTRVGKDAVTNYSGAMSALTDTAKEIEQTLGNDTQRALFRQQAARRTQNAMLQIDAHAAQQTRVWKDGETVARIKGSIADAVANSAGYAEQGGAFQTAKATAIAEVDDLASLRGYDTAQTEQLRASTLADLHGTVLTNMVSLGQTKTARDYLEAAAPEIAKGAPDKLDNLRNLVKQAGIKDESLTLSMEVGGDPRAATKRLDEMFTAGKISADVRDATVQRVEHNWQMRKAQQAEGEKALLGNAYDWRIKNPDKSILDMPPTMYQALKATGHLASIANFSPNQGTDASAYYGLRRMAAEEPEAFAQLDLLKSRHLVGTSDWNRLVELQTSIGKGDAKAMQMERVVGGAVKSIKADMLAAGIDLTPKEGTSQAQDTAKFMSSLYQSLDEAQKAKGAPLQPAEARKIGLDLLREGWVQGSGIFFDDKARRYRLTDEQKAKPFVTVRYGDIPPDVRSAIQRDVPGASAAEIERIYQRSLDRGGK